MAEYVSTSRIRGYTFRRRSGPGSPCTDPHDLARARAGTTEARARSDHPWYGPGRARNRLSPDRPTRRLDPTPDGLADAAAILRAGGLVGLPTETVYGLAAVATDPAAVASVFTAKGRPADDPLIVHLAPPDGDVWDALVARGLVDAAAPAPLTASARVLLATATPGPLTLVLPRGPAVLDAVTSGLPHVAVRFPDHPVAVALLRAVDAPLVAPSANQFGRISPTDVDAVLAELDGRIDAVLDGGPCRVGVESTVARVEDDGAITVLRPGAVGDEALALAGPVRRAADDEGSGGSPGRLLSHYAPLTPLVLVADGDDLPPAVSAGWVHLAWTGDADVVAAALHVRTGVTPVVIVLAPDGRPETAARALYGALRAADGDDVPVITADVPPGDGALVVALRDRLGRAAAR